MKLHIIFYTMDNGLWRVIYRTVRFLQFVFECEWYIISDTKVDLAQRHDNKYSEQKENDAQ